MTERTSRPDYRREAVNTLEERLNKGEDWMRPQRWDPVIPHDTVVTVFPGYVIRFSGDNPGAKGAAARGRWYVEEVTAS